MTSQANAPTLEGRPLMPHLDLIATGVVVVELDLELERTVDRTGVAVDVDDRDVVVGIARVVEEAAGVVEGCRLFLGLVQGAVTGVLFCVTSVIGTKDEQKAEAWSATRTALQLSTSPRASRASLGRWRAKAESERSATVPTKLCGKYIFRQVRYLL